MLEKAMDRGGDRWVIKTFLPRMLDFRHWVKEDVLDEAMAKAEATRTVNSQDPTHPFVEKLMQYMDEQSQTHEQNKTENNGG